MQPIYVLCFLVPLFCELLKVNAIKCYICGPKSLEPFRNISIDNGNPKHLDTVKENFKKCGILESLLKQVNYLSINNDLTTNGSFLQKDEFNDFVMDCPDQYIGCLTQTDANHTTRTCELVAFSECHMANGVTYCYCSTNLCNNGEKKPPAKPNILIKKSPYNDDGENDDEDLSDENGSGDNNRGVGGSKKTNLNRKSINVNQLSNRCKKLQVQKFLIMISLIFKLIAQKLL